MKNVCVITGGGSGIGLATAKNMPREKIIVIAGRTEEKLATAEQELTALGYEAHHIVCDVSIRRDVHELCLFAKEHGTIRNVIHSAGVSPSAHIAKPEELYRINAIGTKNVNMEFRKYMEDGGVIVDVASYSAYTLHNLAIPHNVYKLAEYQEDEFMKGMMHQISVSPDKMRFVYELGKNFVVWYAQKCAFEYETDGIRVVSVSPGLVSTAAGVLEAEYFADVIPGVREAAQHMGDPMAVGYAIATIADERNAFLKGVDIPLDGGEFNRKHFKA